MLRFLANRSKSCSRRFIDADPLWRRLNQAFRSVRGLADRTVARIMAEMPKIGTLSNKTLQAFSAGPGQ